MPGHDEACDGHPRRARRGDLERSVECPPSSGNTDEVEQTDQVPPTRSLALRRNGWAAPSSGFTPIAASTARLGAMYAGL